jgi:hypothetical protein
MATKVDWEAINRLPRQQKIQFLTKADLRIRPSSSFKSKASKMRA